MTAKEYLKQVRKNELLIESKIEEIMKLETMAAKINAVNDGERVQSSGTSDRMADMVCKIADMKNELQKEIDELLDLKREARNVIEQVSEPDLVAVLYKRYLLYMPWEKIAAELSVSCRQVLRLHGKALAEIEKILKLAQNVIESHY